MTLVTTHRHTVLVELSAWLDEIESEDAAPVQAQKFVAHLHEKYPTELLDFLSSHAVAIFTERIGELNRSRRQHYIRSDKAVAFAKAAQEFEETGEPEKLRSGFDPRYTVDGDGTWRRFGDMRKADLEYVADGYADSAAKAKFEETFFRLLAKKVGTRTVEEAIPEETLARLRSSLKV